MRYVYLAGPIGGCSESEAKDWREYVSKEISWTSEIHKTNIQGISPLRCEPVIDGKYKSSSYDDPKFGSSKAIKAKNLFDTKNTDMVLCYLPSPPEGGNYSLGTVAELAWAHALGKPTILVSKDKFILDHPVLDGCADWKLDNLDEAIELIKGILGDYAR